MSTDDNASAYAGYVNPRYLALAAEAHRADKQRTYEALRLSLGQCALDVGCGPGIDTLALSAIVGPAGQVVGVDIDPAMVEEGERRATEAGVSAHVRHAVADAVALPFPAEAFNAVRMERLAQHLTDLDAAVAEMVRVLRLGGWLVALDTEYGSLSVDSDQIDIERRLARFTTARLRNGYGPRTLYRRFKRHQLLDVSVEARPQVITSYELARVGWLDAVERQALAAEAVTEDELAQWRESLERANREDAFFACLNHVLVAGRKAEAGT